MPADATDELYALDPTEFVAARNALAKRLRKEGDTVGAGEIAKLKRPSPAAWAVNQLARRHRTELADLVRLGEQLRAAQDLALAGGEPADLRQAGRTRGAAVSRLADLAEVLFDQRGGGGAAHAGEVAATLVAASLDADAGASVLSGRLAVGLRPPSGFGVFDDVVVPRPAPAPADANAAAEAGERGRRAAEDAVVEARRRWEERSAQARAAVEQVAERRRAVGEAEAEVNRLEDLLEGAQRRLREAVRDADHAEDAASRAEDSTSKAARELRDASGRRTPTALPARAP